MQTSIEKLNQLTFTRFLAAFSVVLYHSALDESILRYIPILAAGPTAVNYFYVLSGFIMAYVYYRPGTQFNLKEYWFARFSRIYPLYIYSFFLVCLFFINSLAKTNPGKIFANLFLYQAWFPEYADSFNVAAWSLSVETFFYILTPLVIIFAAKQSPKKLIWLSLLFWAISQVLHSILYINSSGEKSIYFLGIFPLFHLNTFFIGFAGGVWYLSRPKNSKISPSVNFTLLFISVIAVIAGLFFRDLQHNFGDSFHLDVGLFAPFFLVIILSLAIDSTQLSKILSHPYLILLGEASYAIYLFHVPFFWWLKIIILNSFGLFLGKTYFIVYSLITISLCVLIHKYIEVPTQRWLRKNPGKLIYIFLDVFCVAIMIKLSFLIRLGFYNPDYIRIQRFTLFFGTAIILGSLILSNLYTKYSVRSLSLGIIIGVSILTGLLHYAWQSKWVEVLPRTVLTTIPILVFFALYIYRQTLNQIKMPKALSNLKYKA